MFYDFLILVFLIVNIPKLFIERIFLKKKKSDLLKRLGLKSYKFNPEKKSPIIWIHAVSVGETKAAKVFLDELKIKYPNSYIVISSTTQTGHIEAKKTLKKADSFVFMPFDFSFSVKRIFPKKIKPDLVFFIETDLWYNFIKRAKKVNAKVFLISAKISEKSANRHSKFKTFSEKLFSLIDLVVCQNDLYRERFLKAHVDPCKIEIGGNLKFDNILTFLTQDEKFLLLKKYNLINKKVISITSTHFPEEENILDQISPLLKSNTAEYKFLLAPRHPERFLEVEKLLKKRSLPYVLLSNIENQSGDEKIILIDKMGQLNTFYQLSDLAIVCGSFYSNGVGGHNIFEPIFQNIPTFFGPFMFSQKELEEIALKYKSAIQTDILNISINILEFFKNEKLKNELLQNSKILTKNISGSSKKTLNFLNL
ncbi:MAG: hypothetical protein JXA94_05175 [Parachlamydiales bacterium]|nr:hypothetical protein [Parachlamydiales bacterium]